MGINTYEIELPYELTSLTSVNMRKWCRENTTGDWVWNFGKSTIIFKFAEEKDATWFALIWA